ncbi:DMT family transporter [soil metagenome]
MKSRVDLLLLLVAISWGSTYLVAKELIVPSTVVALLAVRMTAAAVLLLVIIAARRSRISRAELGTGVVLGILLSAVFASETFGIAGTSATNAGLIISLTIVFTPLLEALVSRRRPSGRLLLTGMVAVLGVALLASNGQLRPPSYGDLLVLATAIIRAVHVVTMQRMTANRAVDSLHLTTIQLGTCAVIFTGISLFVGTPVRVYLAALTGQQLWLLVYLVVICTVFAFFVQLWSVRRTSPSQVSLLLGTEPLWAAVIGVMIAGDRYGVVGYLGMALILVGAFFSRRIEQSERERRTLSTVLAE